MPQIRISTRSRAKAPTLSCQALSNWQTRRPSCRRLAIREQDCAVTEDSASLSTIVSTLTLIVPASFGRCINPCDDAVTLLRTDRKGEHKYFATFSLTLSSLSLSRRLVQAQKSFPAGGRVSSIQGSRPVLGEACHTLCRYVSPPYAMARHRQASLHALEHKIPATAHSPPLHFTPQSSFFFSPISTPISSSISLTVCTMMP